MTDSTEANRPIKLSAGLKAGMKCNCILYLKALQLTCATQRQLNRYLKA